jgi:EAL domain-containing protein (putative c-di-GMP-specific phosphodiesterase class I)
VVALARALDLSVTAEGIETEAQHQRLRALACERGQGYLFARPCPAAQLDTMLRPDELQAAA